jgi:AraC-like DNA-binding protein/ligand-binding sensor protein
MATRGASRASDTELKLFREHLERDFQFFQLFFLLINRSCAIKNVDLIWSEHGPAGRVGLRSLTVKDALSGPCLRSLACSREDPAPALCHIINAGGAHESETCGLSDAAASKRVARSRCSEVYDCTFGLVDIAVPVIADRTPIATLFAGQVLRKPPSREGYAHLLRRVQDFGHIDREELERAYWSMPVVRQEEIDIAVEVLETFALYLGNTCSRIAELARDQERHVRERQLLSKELAYLALDGGACERPAMRAILRRLGFTRAPNRVLVLEVEGTERSGGAGVSADLAATAAGHAVESVCSRIGQAISVHLQHRGICVLLDDRGRRGGDREFHVRKIARRVMETAAAHAPGVTRVGVGGSKAEGESLLESYQEARLALACSPGPIAFYAHSFTRHQDLSTRAMRAAAAIGERDFETAWREMAALPMDAERRLRGKLADQRSAFAGALDSFGYAVARLGVDASRLHEIHAASMREMELATTQMELREAYLKNSRRLVGEARDHVLGRSSKRVKIACRVIERAIEQKHAGPELRLGSVAGSLGISASHLARLFRESTGSSFRQYVIRKRIERSQRLLLEPHYNVSQVAELCGFSDANYFARMFRKRVGVSPREYAEHPMDYRGTTGSTTCDGRAASK